MSLFHQTGDCGMLFNSCIPYKLACEGTGCRRVTVGGNHKGGCVEGQHCNICWTKLKSFTLCRCQRVKGGSRCARYALVQYLLSWPCVTSTPLETHSAHLCFAASSASPARDWWDSSAHGNRSPHTSSDGWTGGVGLQWACWGSTVAHTQPRTWSDPRTNINSLPSIIYHSRDSSNQL